MTNHMDVAGNWELTPKELAELFELKGWKMDLGGDLRSPREDEILWLYELLIKEVRDQADKQFSTQRGRFMAYRDPEMPNSVTVFLQVGFAWDNEALDPEERKLLEGVAIDER